MSERFQERIGQMHTLLYAHYLYSLALAYLITNSKEKKRNRVCMEWLWPIWQTWCDEEWQDVRLSKTFCFLMWEIAMVMVNYLNTTGMIVNDQCHENMKIEWCSKLLVDLGFDKHLPDLISVSFSHNYIIFILHFITSINLKFISELPRAITLVRVNQILLLVNLYMWVTIIVSQTEERRMCHIKI